MGNYFFDSSSLVKKYARETGSARIIRLFKPSSKNTLFISRITSVETVAALAKQNRIGSLSSDDLDKAIRRLQRAILRKFAFVEITQDIVDKAIELAKSHGLRGYDAVQLASALNVSTNLTLLAASQLIFVCADKNLNKAAFAEGLTVEDPNDY